MRVVILRWFSIRGMPCIYLCCHQWEKIILLLTQCILRVTSIICWAFLSGNLKILVKIPPRLSQRGVTILPLGSCRARNDIFLMLSNIGEGMNQNNLTFCQRLYVCAKHVIYEIHGLSAQSKQQSKCTGQWSKYNSSIQMSNGKKWMLFKTTYMRLHQCINTYRAGYSIRIQYTYVIFDYSYAMDRKTKCIPMLLFYDLG